MGNTSLGDEAADGTANAGKADDLLAQLAGDEIDRLLADSEEEKEAVGAVGNPAGAIAADVDDAKLVSTAAAEASDEAAAVAPAVLEALGAPIDIPKTAVAETAPKGNGVVAQETDSALAGELDKLFDELKKEPAPDVTDAPKELVASESAETVAEETQPGPGAAPAPAAETSAVAVDDATTAEERGGLIEDEASESTDDEPSVFVEAKLPVYLRPLEWINAPFAFMTDRARDVLGMIGIFTLMQAAVILAYVHFMRKH